MDKSYKISQLERIGYIKYIKRPIKKLEKIGYVKRELEQRGIKISIDRIHCLCDLLNWKIDSKNVKKLVEGALGKYCSFHPTSF